MGVPEMTQLAATAKVTPAVNQIELHPWLQNKHVTDYCNAHGIVLEVTAWLAWAPVGSLLWLHSCLQVQADCRSMYHM
jgi:diketogulonate reductase-like aldo/keto reductase